MSVVLSFERHRTSIRLWQVGPEPGVMMNCLSPPSLPASAVAALQSPLLIPSRVRRLLGIPSNTMTSVAAAVALLHLPLARLSSHLRSLPAPPVPSARLRLSAPHRPLCSLLTSGHGLAVAAVSEAVAAVDEEEFEATEEQQEEAPPSFVLPRLPRPKLDVKERKELASYAHGLGKKLKSQQVGKGGVTPNLVTAFMDNLESNELLKVPPFSFTISVAC